MGLDVTNGGAGVAGRPGAGLSRVAAATFAVLFVMNLLDYVDRNILNAVLPQIKVALDLNNAQAGRLATYFLISYSLFGMVTGLLGDRWRRTWLLALGVGVWSLATLGSGLARSYGQLVLARSFLGIGEATYGVIAPTILLDLFARRRAPGDVGVLPGDADRDGPGHGSGRRDRREVGLAHGVLRRRRAGPAGRAGGAVSARAGPRRERRRG